MEERLPILGSPLIHGPYEGWDKPMGQNGALNYGSFLGSKNAFSMHMDVPVHGEELPMLGASLRD